ncbi:MAG: beta-lactamase family protein [Spirochaetales bacterium]|nr:beta-lactamase family protein [Spirochaetales bacterium]
MKISEGPVQCSPEEAGYQSETIEKTDKHLAKLIEEQKIDSAAYLIIKNDKRIAWRSMGKITLNGKLAEYGPDTIRRIASITKIFTATAIIKLVEEGKIHVKQFVREIIPEFDTDMFKNITISHLLTHSGGILPDSGCMFEPYPRETTWYRSKDWIREILAGNIHYEPGTEWRYCSAGFAILGEIVSRISGIRCEKYIMDKIVKPLGMDDTFFIIPENKKARIGVQGDFDKWFLNFNKLPGKGFAPRAAGGLYSSCLDLSRFGQMMINGGTYGGVRILSRKAVESMTRVQFAGKNFTWVGMGETIEYGYGMNVYTNNTFLSPGSFAHEGAGLSGLYMDPVEKMVFVYFCVLNKNVGWEIRAVENLRNIVWSGII